MAGCECSPLCTRLCKITTKIRTNSKGGPAYADRPCIYKVIWKYLTDYLKKVVMLFFTFLLPSMMASILPIMR